VYDDVHEMHIQMMREREREPTDDDEKERTDVDRSSNLSSLTLFTKCIYPPNIFQTNKQPNPLSSGLQDTPLHLFPTPLTSNNSNKTTLTNTQTNNRKNALFHQLCKIDKQSLHRTAGRLAPGDKSTGCIQIMQYYIDFLLVRF
jgi:hypothetical protein